MSDGMGRELAYLSSHATNRYFIPNWGIYMVKLNFMKAILMALVLVLPSAVNATGGGISLSGNGSFCR